MPVKPEPPAVPELLPGEQLLWSGGPARARMQLSDLALSAYPLAALVLITIAAPGFVRRLPALAIAIVAVVWGAIVLQCAGQLIYLLAHIIVATARAGKTPWASHPPF